MTRAKALGAAGALGAAVLFGATFPLGKRLLEEIPEIVLAGLVYLAGGVGVALVWGALRAAGRREPSLGRRDLGWLAGSILCGGIAAPILLAFGLHRTPAHAAGILANSETLFTVLLAVALFGESLRAREWGGAGLLVAGAAIVGAATAHGGGEWHFEGPALLLGAALGWAFDNNFTQRMSGKDPLQITAIKGVVAGTVNLGIAVAAGEVFPRAPWTLAAAAAVGLLCFGLSLVLFVLALRHLGAARTSSLFATAPAFAVALSWAILGEVPGLLALAGGAVMIPGVWLLLRPQAAAQSGVGT